MKIGLIYGGISVEHEISIITALQVYETLQDKHEIINVYFAKNGKFYIGEKLANIDNYKDLVKLLSNLTEVSFINENGVYLKENKLFGKKHKIDLGFMALHGASGEDGKMQGFLDVLGLPYTGCNHVGSTIGQDKVVTKDILKANNLPIIDYCVAYDCDDILEIKQKISKLTYPIIIKPASLGSSVGINICQNENELEEKLQEAFQYETKLIIETCLSDFKEVNCSILGDYTKAKASQLEEVMTSDQFLSFSDKYLSGSKSKGMASLGRVIPASINDNLSNCAKEICLDAFKVLNLSGVVRFDLIVHNDKVYINEVNTIPGSLAYYLWEHTNVKKSELFEELIKLAVAKKRIASSKITSYESNVLSNRGIKGSKKLK